MLSGSSVKRKKIEAFCLGDLKLTQHTLPTMVSGRERMHGGPRLLLLFRIGLGVWVFKNAASAANSHQPCANLCDPIEGSPPGSPVPGILQARILEWVASAFSIQGCTIGEFKTYEGEFKV